VTLLPKANGAIFSESRGACRTILTMPTLVLAAGTSQQDGSSI
jgi:hypothetical protein